VCVCACVRVCGGMRDRACTAVCRASVVLPVCVCVCECVGRLSVKHLSQLYPYFSVPTKTKCLKRYDECPCSCAKGPVSCVYVCVCVCMCVCVCVCV